MASKARVNISIDSAVHEEMKRFGEITGTEFSAFIEMMCVRFLGQMRPLIRRMEAAQKGEGELTPNELRVMFLQMMGSVHVEAGSEMQTILKELDTIEAEQKKRLPPPLLEVESKQEAIHTPKVRRDTKSKK